MKKPQKGTKSIKGGFTTKITKNTKPPQADWLFQVLQDDRDLGGGGRFAGAAGRLPWGSKQAVPFRSGLLRARAGFDPATLSPCEALFSR